jgi:PEP-CTERM motif
MDIFTRIRNIGMPKRRNEENRRGGLQMATKHAMFGSVAAVAVFSAVCRSTVALAAICPEASSGAAVSCTQNDQPINVFIYDAPVTTIYNVVDNSVAVQEIHGGLGETPINVITSAPTTIIYNLVENTVNVHILGPAGTSVGSSINGNPITTIDSAVDDSVNFADLTPAPHPPTITRIESSPTTLTYDLVDNGINITTGPQDASSSSQSAVLLTPTSQAIVIDNEPVTNLLNLVDNSVNITETISTLSGTMVTVVNNIPTTNIFNVVDNTIDLWLSDPLGIPIALFIDSMPNTLIANLVDNSVNVTVVPEPSSWSLLALGFCAFGLLRRATSRRAKLRAPRRAGWQHAGAVPFSGSLHGQSRQDLLRQGL